MTFQVPLNQTTSYTIYKAAVELECRLPYAFIKAQLGRINRAFTAGEPIWMIAAELKMVHETMPLPRTKTPRQLAKSVTQC